MKKRGVSQIDWIVSLALFLLYLAWFFAFVTPQIKTTTNKDSSIETLKDKFYDEFKWSVYKFPLFVESNNTPKYQPIIMTYESNRTDLWFVDGTNYLLWNNKLILLANLSSEKETFWILSGNDYSPDYTSTGFNSENKSVSTENFTMRLDESLPDSAWYKEKEKFDNAEYKINNFNFDVSTNELNEFGFVAMYTARTENINHTSLVFDKNSEVYNYFLTESDNEYLFTIDLDLDDYDSYYSNNLYYDDFEYGETLKSVNFTNDYLTLYGPDAFTIFLDDDTEFNLSYYNESLHLKMSFYVSDGYLYRYVFHDGDYNNIERDYYNGRFGVIKKLEGIDFLSIETNYTYLKNKWEFKKEFEINVYENSSAYTYLYDPEYIIGSYTPGGRNVISETEDIDRLVDNGEYEIIGVNFRVW